MSYQQALNRIIKPPIAIVDSDSMLDMTSLVDQETDVADYNGNAKYEHIGIKHEQCR